MPDRPHHRNKNRPTTEQVQNKKYLPPRDIINIRLLFLLKEDIGYNSQCLHNSNQTITLPHVYFFKVDSVPTCRGITTMNSRLSFSLRMCFMTEKPVPTRRMLRISRKPRRTYVIQYKIAHTASWVPFTAMQCMFMAWKVSEIDLTNTSAIIRQWILNTSPLDALRIQDQLIAARK